MTELDDVVQRRRDNVLSIHKLIYQVEQAKGNQEFTEKDNRAFWEKARKWEETKFIRFNSSMSEDYQRTVQQKIDLLRDLLRRAQQGARRSRTQGQIPHHSHPTHSTHSTQKRGERQPQPTIPHGAISGHSISHRDMHPIKRETTSHQRQQLQTHSQSNLHTRPHSHARAAHQQHQSFRDAPPVKQQEYHSHSQNQLRPQQYEHRTEQHQPLRRTQSPHQNHTQRRELGHGAPINEQRGHFPQHQRAHTPNQQVSQQSHQHQPSLQQYRSSPSPTHADYHNPAGGYVRNRNPSEISSSSPRQAPTKPTGGVAYLHESRTRQPLGREHSAQMAPLGKSQHGYGQPHNLQPARGSPSADMYNSYPPERPHSSYSNHPSSRVAGRSPSHRGSQPPIPGGVHESSTHHTTAVNGYRALEAPSSHTQPRSSNRYEDQPHLRDSYSPRATHGRQYPETLHHGESNDESRYALHQRSEMYPQKTKREPRPQSRGHGQYQSMIANTQPSAPTSHRQHTQQFPTTSRSHYNTDPIKRTEDFRTEHRRNLNPSPTAHSQPYGTSHPTRSGGLPERQRGVPAARQKPAAPPVPYPASQRESPVLTSNTTYQARSQAYDAYDRERNTPTNSRYGSEHPPNQQRGVPPTTRALPLDGPAAQQPMRRELPVRPQPQVGPPAATQPAGKLSRSSVDDQYSRRFEEFRLKMRENTLQRIFSLRTFFVQKVKRFTEELRRRPEQTLRGEQQLKCRQFLQALDEYEKYIQSNDPPKEGYRAGVNQLHRIYNVLKTTDLRVQSKLQNVEANAANRGQPVQGQLQSQSLLSTNPTQPAAMNRQLNYPVAQQQPAARRYVQQNKPNQSRAVRNPRQPEVKAQVPAVQQVKASVPQAQQRLPKGSPIDPRTVTPNSSLIKRRRSKGGEQQSNKRPKPEISPVKPTKTEIQTSRLPLKEEVQQKVIEVEKPVSLKPVSKPAVEKLSSPPVMKQQTVKKETVAPTQSAVKKEKVARKEKPVLKVEKKKQKPAKEEQPKKKPKIETVGSAPPVVSAPSKVKEVPLQQSKLVDFFKQRLKLPPEERPKLNWEGAAKSARKVLVNFEKLF